MAKHISGGVRELEEFWDKSENEDKKLFFVREDANYPDYSTVKYLVGSQTVEDYIDSQYWGIEGSFMNKTEAVKYMTKLANKHKNGVIWEIVD